MLFALAYFAYFNNISILIAEHGIGDSAVAGMTTALSSLIGIVAGLVMPWIHRGLRRFTLPCMILCILLGMFLEVWAYSVILVHLASALIGFSYSVVMPFMVASLTRAVPELNHTVTSALFLVANSVGASVSAVALNAVAGWLGLESAEGQVWSGICLLIILGVGCSIYLWRTAENRQPSKAEKGE